MQKSAQKRSLINKLKEMTNVSGIAAEKYFKPELLRVMNSLRKSDNDIRSIVIGKQIEDGDPGADLVSLKELLKSARTNLNRREYMSAVADLGRFHKKLFEINSIISKFNFDVDKIHHQFLFQDLKDQHLDQLKDLHKRWANQKYNLTKEASIMDFFHNIGKRRGRALAAWEKRYPKLVGKIKDHSYGILNKSESIYTGLLESLKAMAEARAARNIDMFVGIANDISKTYSKYDGEFKTYYTESVKPFIDKSELFMEKVNDNKPDSIVPDSVKSEAPQSSPVSLNENPSSSGTPTDPSPMPEMSVSPHSNIPYFSSKPNEQVENVKSKVNTVNEPPAGNVLDLTKGILNTTRMPLQLNSLRNTVELPTQQNPQTAKLPVPFPQTAKSPSLAPAPATDRDDEQPLTQVSPGLDTLKFPRAHVKFLNSLQSMSNEDPFILSSYIKKYASSIETSDPTTAIKLFNIAKLIKG